MDGYGSDFMPWVDRFLEYEEMTDKEVDKLAKEHQKATEEIYLLLALLWLRMGDEINLGRALLMGLDDVRVRINSIYNRLYETTITPSITVYLQSIYREGYADALNRLPSEFRPTAIPYLDDVFVGKQINLRWAGDGKLYSDRIWEYKDQLKRASDRILHESITAGRDITKTSREFAQEMGSSYSNAERLIRTETNYILNQSELEVLKATGVEMYEYIAYLDSRTSMICAETDGKKFLTSEAVVGINYPPLHPNCRSTVAPLLELKNNG